MSCCLHILGVVEGLCQQVDLVSLVGHHLALVWSFFRWWWWLLNWVLLIVSILISLAPVAAIASASSHHLLDPPKT